jgi:hypothetical protein
MRGGTRSAGTTYVRLAPCGPELINHDEVVARGEEDVTVTGGFLDPGDPRSLGHARVFSGLAGPRRAGVRGPASLR